jgi:isopenicillin N synthase-like dioxygenase
MLDTLDKYSREFFQLPEEEKRKIAMIDGGKGKIMSKSASFLLSHIHSMFLFFFTILHYGLL